MIRSGDGGNGKWQWNGGDNDDPNIAKYVLLLRFIDALVSYLRRQSELIKRPEITKGITPFRLRERIFY